jgi:hypothetical protein
MDTCRMEGFIAVDVTQTSYGMLVHQQSLDLTRSIDQSSKAARRKIERLGAWLTECPPDVLAIAGQTPYPAETPRIAKAKLSATAFDSDPQVGVFLDLLTAVAHGQLAGHTQGKNEFRV